MPGKRGFRGATCALGPPELLPNFKVPGQVEEGRPEAFFSIPEGEYSTDTVIKIDVVGSNPLPLSVFMSIGVMPTAAAHQFEVLDSTLIEFLLPSTDPSPAAAADAPKKLFIVVQAANSAKDKVPFSITSTGLGSLVPGLPDWALGVIIAGVVLCVCIVAGVVIFCVYRATRGGGGGGKPKKVKEQPQTQTSQQFIPMQQAGNQSGQWGGGQQLTQDYPSAAGSTGNSQHFAQAQQQLGYPSGQQPYGATMQTNTMQQGYGGSQYSGQGYGGAQSTELMRGSQTPMQSFHDASSYHEDPQMQPLW